MVKLSLLVAVCAISASLAYPIAEEHQTSESERELQLRQGGALAAILGQLGTALLPLLGSVLGPILTNLGSGISDAVNSLNPPAETPSKEESAGSEAPDLVVRIPHDNPLYALLLAHHSPDKEGLSSVGPGLGAGAQKPLSFGGKFAAVFHPAADPAPVHVDDRDSAAVDSADYDDDDEEEDEKVNPHVKRYPQRVRTETEYA